MKIAAFYYKIAYWGAKEPLGERHRVSERYRIWHLSLDCNSSVNV